MMEKNRTELSEVRKQRLILQNNIERLNEALKLQEQAMEKTSQEYQDRLTKQEEASERLLSAVLKRAEAAEHGLGELTKEFTKRLGSMEMQLETVHVASSSSGRPSGEVNDKIGQLEADIGRLRERGENLEKRYHEGDLNDTEKRFVNSLMKFSQDVHEKAMVAKENELRRRDNMVTTLQQKVGKLESTLAKCLKDKGKGDNYVVSELKEKSMLNLNMWMSSPLKDIEAPLLASKSPVVKTINVKSDLASSRFPPIQPVQTNSPPTLNTPTFAKLDEDISDFDDIPLPRLGKRNRAASPSNKATQDTSPRPTRRSKPAARKGDESKNQVQAGEKKKAENMKLKARKRP
ncbi:hypothetical protein GGU10DRAFT_353671 [Lentinula aff. detonsa]|uniref:Uncharacterized protein n=1 Tax=Lentinula aff. detonsa TaxID=2804958 RepID=A0AA38NPN7_9AGAR|nr:hypothetical protein GGU10DRAFT_353671 [Lentinula aff. detonsa]